MLTGRSVQNIDIFQKPKIKELVLASNNWDDFSDQINKLGNYPENNKTKGDVFELLTSLYLINNPIFSTKLNNLWHHTNLPSKIFDSLSLQRPEIGVDLIAESNDGNLWAIQCKYHNDVYKNISYEEVSTFFSITEREITYKKIRHRIISSSALEVSKKISKVHKEKLGFITYSDFSQLGNVDFKNFHSILQNNKIILNKYLPREHQKIALEKCLSYFKNESRGKLIHPCGTGKSLTGYWFFRYMNGNNALIVVPSLQLVKQTLKTWSREFLCEGIDIDWIAVCSDDDVKNLDDPAINIFDIGIEVNTNAELIASFFKKQTQKIKIVITTYQSSSKIIESVKKANMNFDIGIFDEAHKTVGNRNKPFAQLLYDSNVLIKKRLFMTATERVFKGDSEHIVSMDDKNIYGNIVDQFSFKSALEQNPPILCDYRIFSTIISKNQIKQLIENNEIVSTSNKLWSFEADASTFASLIALRKIIKEQKIKHIISFHRDIKRANDFKKLNEEVNKLGGKYGYLNSFHISGKFSTGLRSEIINRFTYEEPSLISNARCLTEGVDIPQVDAILFADPKQSKVDIVQAAGRAMRIYKNKKFGYIILPVVIDEEDKSLIHENAFKQIVTVLSALGMSDERIISEFQEIAQGKVPKERIFRFVSEEVLSSINLNYFYSNIDLKIWNRLSFAKTFMFDKPFEEWMNKETILKKDTANKYLSSVRKITNELLKMKPEYSDVSELLNHEDLNDLKDHWLSFPENKALDKKHNNMYSCGFKKLIEFFEYDKNKN